jgi:hypothetical protein
LVQGELLSPQSARAFKPSSSSARSDRGNNVLRMLWKLTAAALPCVGETHFQNSPGRWRVLWNLALNAIEYAVGEFVSLSL